MNEIVNKIPNWARWPLTPVASGITFAVVLVSASIAAKILVFLGGERGWSDNFLQYLIVPGIGGYCSVTVAAIVAPRFKKITAIIFGSIWIFLAGGLTFFTVMTAEWKNLIMIASICIGCGIAALASYDETRYSVSDQEI